ncbi:nicotinate phosphoribosyltransferase [Ceraceosorus guamensis]|uniref:Nicotinate phosphoribosyltransferase n=1 Tax=Ceraceosorus guamensis TaxID=1522189 RepID=A0A316VPE9_9BASI|nr:nicotinate phosphoribosyltransferase [Ceraceosorus guamensis]PWN39200.1 nicotinate phosphoribosyltransferase [Ceraceosorus guamensis]
MSEQSPSDGTHPWRPVCSILDTDLYKLTMQQAVAHHYPSKRVAYRFTNRSAAMKFTRKSVAVIQRCIDDLAGLSLDTEEEEWLKRRCPYLKPDYIESLAAFRFKPKDQVTLTFVPEPSGDAKQEEQAEELGQIEMDIRGLWKDVILYEVPLMAIVSEVYFSTVDKMWSMRGQRFLAKSKAEQLVSAGIRYSEFGTRRRRSYLAHKVALQGLMEGSRAGPGALLGTSNVHFAQLYDLNPIGTVAHEWMMAVAALHGYEHANLRAMQLWDEVYSAPHFTPANPSQDLTIALTDTFSTRVFFSDLLSNEKGQEIARRWRGLRQDSGDPAQFVKRTKEVYDQLGVDSTKKVVIFSDGLDVARCLELAKTAQDHGVGCGFGIGTSITNDFACLEDQEDPEADDYDAAPASSEHSLARSKALNMVIKLREIEGKPCVKISDDLTKNTGDPAEVAAVKRRFHLDVVQDAIEDA